MTFGLPASQLFSVLDFSTRDADYVPIILHPTYLAIMSYNGKYSIEMLLLGETSPTWMAMIRGLRLEGHSQLRGVEVSKKIFMLD